MVVKVGINGFGMSILSVVSVLPCLSPLEVQLGTIAS